MALVKKRQASKPNSYNAQYRLEALCVQAMNSGYRLNKKKTLSYFVIYHQTNKADTSFDFRSLFSHMLPSLRLLQHIRLYPLILWFRY
jgi:hypothetical protein